MIDKNFLKKLTILFVEDDDTIREELSLIFNKLFKELITAEDGKVALEKFKNNEKQINLIISDINMPNLDGIELLDKVKEINPKIPFIYTTAYTDMNYLLSGLRKGVDDYFVKPTNIMELLLRIEKITKRKEEKNKLDRYRNELEEYFEIINNIAIVYMFDLKGSITYTNDFLIELVKCHELELIDLHYRVIYHHDMPKEVLEDQWNSLNKGNKWQGKIKYLSKEGSEFYANCTIIPMKDKNGKLEKFVSVNFLTTKEESEKRAYKKKVLYNLQETRKVFKVAQEKINYLNKIITSFKDSDEKQNGLNILKSENAINLQTLQGNENKVKNIKIRLDQLTFGVNSKINKIALVTSEMKDTEEKSSKKIEKVKDEIKVRESFIKRIKEEIEEKSNKIDDLKDVLAHRNSQLEKNKDKNV